MIKHRHTGLVVESMDSALSFYRDKLGLEVMSDNVETGDFIRQVTGVPITMSAEVQTVKLGYNDEHFFELLRYKSITPIHFGILHVLFKFGFNHIAFTVKNVDRYYEMLSASGVKFISQPLISPDGKAKVCFCQDPFGNYVELVEEL